MDHTLEHHASYIGKPISALPTPALVISLPVLRRNIDALHKHVEELGIGFRPHVKTLKTLEVTRLMLKGGKYRSIVASTLAEVHGVLPLVEEGLLDECLYGMPIYPGCLPRLAELRKKVRIQLMVDNEQQVAALEETFETHGGSASWDVFIKLDVGSRRAGVDQADTEALRSLVDRVDSSAATTLHGFYVHAGHSYGGRRRDEAEATLNVELSAVLAAAALAGNDRELVVSIGSTPTAHVVASLKAAVPHNVRLELHAGNYPANDLQQLSTGVIAEADQAARVVAEVCSVYPRRNEALINAGVVAMSREVAGAYPGFGRVVGKPDWGIVRLSQEHGIIGNTSAVDSDQSASRGQAPGVEGVSEQFAVGQRVSLCCNHVCITAAAFFAFYIVDDHDVVQETWVPWKGW
ncbi:putative serine dehydratase domain-containing protein [Microdochium trichocladiopsis]|uniref:D-serine dehydratase n=1 Tax=Microdochium trichocladiopsis TaxID=1682393 RepID=A0A9P9BUT5_9PEZI|nr:putative serine dehydratase domain-containing protein [Microdochium trichocladiopsis]KAH7039553.1 putative serine dehydratase domain-containing protein [Microdochium trichocladiopsis]